MLMTAYSARSDNKAVSAPGPAINGKAMGTMLAPPLPPSFLMISRPRIISTAKMNNTKAPATANEALSMPKSFNSASPAKKNAKNRPKAVRQACPALMVLCCSFMLMKMGMEPKISMMAAITMKAPKISTKLILLNMTPKKMEM